MGNQASVQSIDALKDIKASLGLFAEDVLAALGAVDMEIRRTVQWLQHDRKAYWQEQIKRRREDVAQARAEVFRRKLAKTDDYTPAMSEQKELLRRAEDALRDAETRAAAVRKWEPALQQALFEYHGSTRRIKDLASGDVPRAAALLELLIVALESYLALAPPPGAGPEPSYASIANAIIDAEPESPPPAADDAAPEAPESPPADDDPGPTA
jgi:hypothetical protein